MRRRHTQQSGSSDAVAVGDAHTEHLPGLLKRSGNAALRALMLRTLLTGAITGGRYSPTGDSWTPTTTTAAPAGRYYPTAVWTGTEMIAWGGVNIGYLNDGGRYNPAGNSWTAVTATAAPAARNLHTAVWTGTEMIIWGGYNGSYLNDTFSYTPGRVLFLYQRP